MFRLIFIAACAFVVEHEVSGTHGKIGFGAGSGLTLIAQGSAEQANNAVANQHVAARQAAFVAKNTLAQTATGASAIAQAALVGKKVLLQRLEREMDEAHRELQGEIQQLTHSQRAASATREASQQAQLQVKALTAALNSAKGTAVHAAQAADEATSELAAQSSMVSRAKQRLSILSDELYSIQNDVETGAQKAEAAARIAQSNAAQKLEGHSTEIKINLNK